jgi:hypothetical protein
VCLLESDGIHLFTILHTSVKNRLYRFGSEE